MTGNVGDPDTEQRGRPRVSVQDDEQRHFDPHLVEYLVVVVPNEEAIEGVLVAVYELAASGPAVVLDGAVVYRDADGEPGVRELSASVRRGAMLVTPLGLLSERDLELIARELPPASLAVVVVVEDRWALPLARAAREVGGEIVGGERIPAARLRKVLPELHGPRRARR